MTCLHGSSSCLVCIHSKDSSTTLLTSSGQAVYLRHFDHHTLHCGDVRSCCQLPDLDFGAYQRQGWCSTVAREEALSWRSLEPHSFSLSLEHTNGDDGTQQLDGKKTGADGLWMSHCLSLPLRSIPTARMVFNRCAGRRPYLFVSGVTLFF